MKKAIYFLVSAVTLGSLASLAGESKCEKDQFLESDSVSAWTQKSLFELDKKNEAKILEHAEDVLAQIYGDKRRILENASKAPAGCPKGHALLWNPLVPKKFEDQVNNEHDIRVMEKVVELHNLRGQHSDLRLEVLVAAIHGTKEVAQDRSALCRAATLACFCPVFAPCIIFRTAKSIPSDEKSHYKVLYGSQADLPCAPGEDETL